MATTPVNPAASSPSGSTSSSAPAASRPNAGFHLPSYLLGLTTALILAGAALFFWPRPQPAALQLQPPPTLAPAAAPAAPAAAVATQAPTPSPLVVFVSGAVAQPGLYSLAAGARIGDAIAAAGGLLPGVDPALVNQAQPLVDGAQLHIPAPTTAAPDIAAAAQPAETPPAAEADVSTAPPTLAPMAAAAAQPPAGLSVAQPPALPTPTAAPADRAAAVDLSTAGARINVNTATGAELESLPGIGPAKAQAIIDNRPYATVDELDRVPGIGPATLEQIRPLVTVE